MITKQEILGQIFDTLEETFATIRKAYEAEYGNPPARYSVPQWLYDLMSGLQENGDKPTWKGKPLDPWDKPNILGQ